ncbi:MAG: hypothetical protein MJE68_28315, partial [Proteobacteria bacterium]|nr:hypothetical protein [Pseudomonadota bacterium]
MTSDSTQNDSLISVSTLSDSTLIDLLASDLTLSGKRFFGKLPTASTFIVALKHQPHVTRNEWTSSILLSNFRIIR